MGLGDYPAGYNRHIHGPYNPATYYGKPDTPFPDVKLLELPQWLARRSLNPMDWIAACSRFCWRWNHKWLQPKRIGFAGIYQICFLISAWFYVVNYPKHRRELRYKYH